MTVHDPPDRGLMFASDVAISRPIHYVDVTEDNTTCVEMNGFTFSNIHGMMLSPIQEGDWRIRWAFINDGKVRGTSEGISDDYQESV